MSAQQVTNVFAQIRARLDKTLTQLPTILGNEAVNYSLEAFAEEGWEGTPWKDRASKKDSGRNLLVKSSRLKRSIRIIQSTQNSVRVGTDVPYARIHNFGGVIEKEARQEKFIRNRYKRGPKAKMFGGMGAFKKGTTPGEGQTIGAHTITIPARPFLKYSKGLAIALRQAAREELRRALNHAA